MNKLSFDGFGNKPFYDSRDYLINEVKSNVWAQLASAIFKLKRHTATYEIITNLRKRFKYNLGP